MTTPDREEMPTEDRTAVPTAYLIVGKTYSWLQWTPAVAEADASLVSVQPLYASLAVNNRHHSGSDNERLRDDLTSAVRGHVEKLANTGMQLPLAEWSKISGDILLCADTLDDIKGDRQTSDDVGRLRALLEEELVWHEERDKSLSKQPQSNQVVWRRAEHQERIDVIRAALKGVPQPATPKEAAMTEAQIKHMVDRFLMWKLPEHFNPDDGISFDPVASKGTPYEFRRSL
jgi:hypothetical protein